MRAVRVLLALAALSLSGCSLVIDSDSYTPPPIGEFCSVSECKAANGDDHTCNALGACIDCDVDDDGFAGSSCAGLAGQTIPWGDCQDANPDRFPGSFPRCFSSQVEACEIPDVFDQGEGLDAILELGTSGWTTISPSAVSASTDDTMSFAYQDSNRWLVAGVNGSTSDVHQISFAQQGEPTITTTLHAVAPAFSSSGFTPTTFRLQTLNGASGGAAFGQISGVPALVTFDMYANGGEPYASLSTVVQNDGVHAVRGATPIAVEIPGNAYPLPTTGLVGVRTEIASTTRALVSGRSSFVQNTTISEDLMSGGEFAASGQWAVYSFLDTDYGSTSVGIWNPDLGGSPSAGVFGKRNLTGVGQCLTRLRVAHVSDTELYVGYQIATMCGGMETGEGDTAIWRFTCTTVDGCLIGSNIAPGITPDGAYDIASIGDLVWLVAESAADPSELRLTAIDPADPHTNIVNAVVLDVDDFANGASIEEVRLTGDRADGVLDVGIVVRIRRTSGEVSTHFFDVRGCETL